VAHEPGRAPHVELREVSKHFGGARALESVSIKIETGSVHAFVGENGAGKSTLGKIISGVVAQDRGEVLLHGTPVRFRSPREALDHGVATIAQELAIVPELSAAENVLLGVEPRAFGLIRHRELRRKYSSVCSAVGFEVPAEAMPSRMRTAEQQKLEILRAIARNAELIVMDEPSAALTREEMQRLHESIRALRDQGRTVVLVSHFLDEVLDLADTISVLRDGRLVRSGPAAPESERTLIEAMLGRSFDGTFPPKEPPPTDSPVVLSVEGLSAFGVSDVSLDVRAGEIVGLAGLVGAGRTELAQAIVGMRRPRSGTVAVGDRRTGRPYPRGMLQLGLAMIPESRKEDGLIPDRSITDNTALSSLASRSRFGVVRPRAERRATATALRQVDVRAGRHDLPVSVLSGGNQQKLLFARTLLCEPAVLIADEPTRGVDVGARRSIYELLITLTRQGLGVLLISSDVEEVLGLSHRVLVMRSGRLVAELDGLTATEHDVLDAAFRDRASIPS